jgi:putative transposase
MLTLSHYKFKEFLKSKAYENRKVVLDVSWTGEIIHSLNGKKIVTSRCDGLTMDRDLNGVRGIFLRAVVDTPWLGDRLSLNVVNKS